MPSFGYRCIPLLFLLEPILAAPPELIGPFGGSAAVVQVDALDAGTVMAATSNALLFRSRNGGDSWVRVPFPAELRGTLHAFAIAPWTGVYMAGLSSDASHYAGFYMSGDGGRTWTRPKALAGKDIWSIAVWSRDQKIIAAGAADGIFLSRDGGEQWSRVSPESNLALMPVVSLEFDPVDPQILYAGTPHLPWKTTDGGVTWSLASVGMENDSDIFSIHVDVSRPGRIFAGACSGVYRSLSQAGSWTRLSRAKNASYRTYQIAQDPGHSNILFTGTTDGLSKSVDSGTTWRKLSSYATRSIAFDPGHPGRMYTATDAGLFRSDDLGESLKPIDEGFSNRRLISLAAGESTLYASSSAGLMSISVSGNEWENIGLKLLSRDRDILKILPLDPAHLYVLTSTNLLLSSDAGRTWAVLGTPPEAKLTALLAAPHGGRRLLLGAEDGIYYSDNRGKTWNPADTPRDVPPIRSLSAIGGSFAAITRSAVLLSPDGIKYRFVASPAEGSEIYDLIGTDHAGLIAATSRGLRISGDSGKTWRTPGQSLGESSVSAVYKHPTRPGVLFAARYGIIFSSADDGQTWLQLTPDGEELPAVRGMVVAPAVPDRLFAITQVQGIYSVPLDPESGVTECRARNCAAVRIRVP